MGERSWPFPHTACSTTILMSSWSSSLSLPCLTHWTVLFQLVHEYSSFLTPKNATLETTNIANTTCIGRKKTCKWLNIVQKEFIWWLPRVQKLLQSFLWFLCGILCDHPFLSITHDESIKICLRNQSDPGPLVLCHDYSTAVLAADVAAAAAGVVP